MKFLFIILAVGIANNVFCENGPQKRTAEKVTSGERQKRLLFYDEEGTLVKTFSNPFLRNYLTPEQSPVYSGLVNPLLSFFRPHHYSTPTYYVIPVSNEIIQAANKDPSYQHKLMYLPARDVTVAANPLCNEKRTQIPSPSCNEFLNCWDGWAFQQECPAGLLFSSQGYCDYPEKVNCFERRLNKEEAKPFCSKDFEVFRSQSSCGEFFVCVGRQPVKFKCPADLAYSQDLGICDYPDRVNCKTSITSPPVSTQSATTDKNQKIDSIKSIAAKLPNTQSPPNVAVWSNSVYNSESWSSTHVAMSRQDAIRQLELRQLAKVSA